ncbi:Lrp/AsnC family transcriptional regulator [Pseudonocardia nigra]|uniref:Lrp/AsnC family transcriptional regulator n=1 Tax=Pseudonocardia nigra TaxID=1921578 RepID=UPI001C5F41CA|nr:Lrp/AsnC family transcriptional regulator [Pseudonocardia nigra]
MDAVDRRIIGLLLEDADRTYAQLGREVSLSAAAVHERVRRLRASGVIRRTTIEVDADAIGRPVLAFVLVDTEGWVKQTLFDASAADPRIEEAHSVAGSSNFLLKVRVGDPDELEDVLHDLYRVDGVVRTRTIMVLRRGFERGVGPPAEPS